MTSIELMASIAQRIAETELTTSLWENVKRMRRDDGSDFPEFSDNFSGCMVYCPYLDPHDRFEMRVSGRARGELVTDSIQLKQIVCFSKFTASDERIVHPAHGQAYFMMSPGEAETAIADRVASLRAALVHYKEQLRLAYELFHPYVIENK